MFCIMKSADFPTRVCTALVLFAVSVVGAAAQAKPPQPLSSSESAQKARAASVIRGRVVYSDTGRPLRRAEVSLISHDTGSWGEHSVTNRRGEFVFANVSAGKYFVLVKALDIVSPADLVLRNSSLPLQIALGQIEDGFAEVTLDGRTSVKTEIRVSRGGVITGRVLTEYDEPVAKAAIKLFQVKDGKLEPVSSTQYFLDSDKWMFETDSRGIYRIAGLAAGEYIVRASESNEGGNPDDASEGTYTDGSMLVAYYPRALQVEEATGVTVQQGAETRDVDIHIPDREVHRLSGTVFVGGYAARDAEIRLSRGEPLGKTRHDQVSARADNNGNWEIRSVPDGVYTLTVSGFIIGMVRRGDEKGYATVAPQRREITVSGSDVTGLRADLVEGSELGGVVSLEGNLPLPDRLMLELVRSDLSSRNLATKPVVGSAEKFSAVPGADDDEAPFAFVREHGEFAITQLTSGSFHLRVSGLGANLYVKSITLDGRDLLRNPIKIEEGKTVGGVRIVLSSSVVTFSGRAMDKSAGGEPSKPLTDAAILLFPVEAERRRLTEGPLAARTNGEGRFVIKGAPGEYFVFVLDRRRKGVPAVMPTEEALIKNSAKQQKIRLQAGDEKRTVEVFGPE